MITGAEPMYDIKDVDTSTVILGVKRIAKALGLQEMQLARILKYSTVPGAFRVKRDGTAMWGLSTSDAEWIKTVRRNTPEYDPNQVRTAFCVAHGYQPERRPNDPDDEDIEDEHNFEFNRADLGNSPATIIENGDATIEDWTEFVQKYRDNSYMDRPVFMHKRDLGRWIRSNHPDKKRESL